ncbi:MAG: hypothetical protein ABW352_16600 [Polyangiales bacterium]
MKLRLALGSLLLASCMAKSKPVRMPDGQEALRIECNYSSDNCERKARSECHGSYVRVTKGDMSCKDCGALEDRQYRDQPFDSLGEHPPGEGNNVFKGVLYVRCK